MIPKKIHYCWFGYNPKPKLAEKCIASWREFCPDYEIIEWNESNFDVSKSEYTRFCYEAKKWAFLSDYVRLVILYEHGGVYFDTDNELIRNIDELLAYEAFYGFERADCVNTGLGFGAQSEHITVKAMMDAYENLKKNEDGSFSLTNCPAINTRVLCSLGLVPNGKRQNVAGAEIFPVECFNPYDDVTGKKNVTADSYSINHYGKSWVSGKEKFKEAIARPICRVFGPHSMDWMFRRGKFQKKS